MRAQAAEVALASIFLNPDWGLLGCGVEVLFDASCERHREEPTVAEAPHSMLNPSQYPPPTRSWCVRAMEVVLEALLLSPRETRAQLASHVVLCGGTSMLPGLRARLTLR